MNKLTISNAFKNVLQKYEYQKHGKELTNAIRTTVECNKEHPGCISKANGPI